MASGPARQCCYWTWGSTHLKITWLFYAHILRAATYLGSTIKTHILGFHKCACKCLCIYLSKKDTMQKWVVLGFSRVNNAMDQNKPSLGKSDVETSITLDSCYVLGEFSWVVLLELLFKYSFSPFPQFLQPCKDHDHFACRRPLRSLCKWVIS